MKRRACDLQELVDGVAGNWTFVIRLPTQRGGDVGGEVLEKVTLQLHTVEFKFNVQLLDRVTFSCNRILARSHLSVLK